MPSKLISTIIFFVCVISCEYEPAPPSLWKIGSHKKEFQKVFDHYSNPRDSLKLRAAEFLYRNMDEHFYYQTKNEDEVDAFFENIETQVSVDYPGNTALYVALRRELFNKAVTQALSDGSLKNLKYRKRLDIKNIQAEFLIENIEYAFKAWDFPWSRNYSFEEFSRFILPYRYGNEVPEPWRKDIYEQFKWVIDSVENPNDPMVVASFVNKQFNHKLSWVDKLSKNGIRLKISNQLEGNVNGICNEQAGLGVCVLRAMGIPATVVSIPKWGNLAYGHQVTGMLDADGSWHYFNFGDTGPEVDLKMEAPKMFFHHFDKMKRFKPILVDASDELMDVIDLEVKVNAKDEDEIYLCVFGNLSWYPLFQGKNKGSTAVFENVGNRENLYLTAIKSWGKLKAVSDIFTTDSSGNITYYKPNHEKLLSASLVRKFKYWTYLHRLEALIGGEFSVSDSKDFANRKKLYRIDTILKYNNNTLKCSAEKGNYFRYDFPQLSDSIFDGPAEISFYTTQGNTLKKIEGNYFGSPQLSEEHIQLMTDNDLLTYVEVWDCEQDLKIETGKMILRKDDQPIWIAVEVDTPTVVTHVGICPRNDKNGIYPGMRYELFYWDDVWKSLGTQVATGDSIHYDGIPENAVLWLRNLDEGKEERVFTLEDGEQIWW